MGGRNKFPSDKARRKYFAMSNQNSDLISRSSIDEKETHDISHFLPDLNKTDKKELKISDISNSSFKKRKTKSYPEKTLLHEYLKNTAAIHEKIKKLNPEQMAGAIAFSASAITGNPIPLMVYKGYKVYKFSEKLSEKLSKFNIEDELIKLSKQTANTTVQKLSEEKINKISSQITKTSQDIQLLNVISQVSGYDEKAVKTLFQATINDSLNVGLEKATNFAVEAVF